jgi:hypothetical protein
MNGATIHHRIDRSANKSLAIQEPSTHDSTVLRVLTFLQTEVAAA